MDRAIKRIGISSVGAALPAIAVGLLLAGCAPTHSPPLYQWDAYQPQVYEYFKGEKGPEAQIEALEAALERIRAKGGTPPPGFHAQLGMLYAARPGRPRRRSKPRRHAFRSRRHTWIS